MKYFARMNLDGWRNYAEGNYLQSKERVFDVAGIGRLRTLMSYLCWPFFPGVFLSGSFVSPNMKYAHSSRTGK